MNIVYHCQWMSWPDNASLLLLRRIVMLVSLVGLSACETLRKTDTTRGGENWQTDSKQFHQAYQNERLLNQWRYSAKVGVVTAEVSEQANMVWSYDREGANVVRLFGPLGLGAIKIEFDHHGVQLSDKKGVLHRGDSAQDLLEDIVGWSIPVDALRYWLFSLPSPNKAYDYLLGEQGEVVALRQLGWRVDYLDYRSYFDDSHSLARKITASKQVSPNQRVKVTLITRRWN